MTQNMSLLLNVPPAHEKNVYSGLDGCTVQVILRGKYVIYKCCQMQYVFPNGTEWTRNIAGHVLHLYYPTGKKEGRVERKSQQPFPALSIQRAHICCGQTYSRH